VHTTEETNNSKLITKYVEAITGATFAAMFDINFCTTGNYYLQLNIQFDGKCQSRPIISKEDGTNRRGYCSDRSTNNPVGQQKSTDDLLSNQLARWLWGRPTAHHTLFWSMACPIGQWAAW